MNLSEGAWDKLPVRLSLLFPLVLWVASCTPAQPKNELVLNIALAAPIDPPNGQSANGYTTIVDDWLFEPLFRIARSGAPQPVLAHAVERLADGRLRFQLRPGATFSDGSPVSLEDAARAALAQGLKVETGVDTLTVSTSTPGISAESLLAVANVTKSIGATRIGSGPFILVERDAQHMLLRRREIVPGRINQIRLSSYDGPREAMARVLRGDANFLSRVQARDVEFFEGIAHLQVVRGTAPHVVALALNPARFSAEERRALARALPAVELTGAAFGDGCRPWTRSSNGGALPAGRPLEILSEGSDAELIKLGLAARRALGERGGALKQASLPDTMQAINGGNFDLAVITPLVWPMGMASLLLHSGALWNSTHYANAAVDAALEQGDWTRVLDALDSDPPYAFICTRERIAIADARIKNPQLGPWGLLETLPDWEVSE